jgi:RNA polymerase sigma factor (sigma-70 family)
VTSDAEPWVSALNHGHIDAAWDAFMGRYRRVVFAAIRHYAQDYDDVMEIFAYVCEALRDDDCRRLRVYAAQRDHQARFTTWLVTVVRHLAVDWFRQRDGRRRLPALIEQLPPLQRQIFVHVFVENHSHIEAYELIRTRNTPDLSFRDFQAELRRVYDIAARNRRGAILPDLVQLPPTHTEEIESATEVDRDQVAIIEQTLASLLPEDRVVVELYVMEELPASDVARIAGLPNAKAVYNRAYRVLASLRERLEGAGVHRGDR